MNTVRGLKATSEMFQLLGALNCPQTPCQYNVTPSGPAYVLAPPNANPRPLLAQNQLILL